MRIVWLLLLSACGSDAILDYGSYKVHHTVTLTTDPFLKVGDTFYMEWTIDGNGEKLYSLDVTQCCHVPEKDGGLKMKGRQSEEHISFSFTEVNGGNCPFYTNLHTEITPVNDSFTGYAHQMYFFCTRYDPATGTTNMQGWISEFEVRSE